MERAISCAEALLVKEERVVDECEGVEDVEASLYHVSLHLHFVLSNPCPNHVQHTFFAKINASLINSFNLVFNLPCSVPNATSVA